MILLTAAFYDEVAPLIKFLSLTRREKSPPIYDTSNITLIITGPGQKNVEFSLRKLTNPKAITQIINLGIAATNDLKIEIGTIKVVSHSICKDEEQFINPNGEIRCHTISNTYNHNKQLDLSLLFDQELFYLAQYAEEKGIEIKSFKIVSDHGDLDLQQIKKETPKYAESLTEYLLNSNLLTLKL